MRFVNRYEAGKHLAQKLMNYAENPDVFVLALPRGGVPVGFEVAQALKVPLDVFVVRKLGVPGQDELAFGAIASGGVRVLNDDVVQYLHLSDEVIEKVTAVEQEELARREKLYRGSRQRPDVVGKIVILVDDGLATGATMKAAVEALRKHNPAQLIVAAPVAARSTCEIFEDLADNIICICERTSEPFYAVGLWYEDFRPTSDAEVRELLAAATRPPQIARNGQTAGT